MLIVQHIGIISYADLSSHDKRGSVNIAIASSTSCYTLFVTMVIASYFIQVAY